MGCYIYKNMSFERIKNIVSPSTAERREREQVIKAMNEELLRFGLDLSDTEKINKLKPGETTSGGFGPGGDNSFRGSWEIKREADGKFMVITKKGREPQKVTRY